MVSRIAQLQGQEALLQQQLLVQQALGPLVRHGLLRQPQGQLQLPQHLAPVLQHPPPVPQHPAPL